MIIVIILSLIVLTIWGNIVLEINTYTILSDNLQNRFNGYCIAHVSDLHNTQMGKDNIKLINKLKSIKSDIIEITEDIIDFRNANIDIAFQFGYILKIWTQNKRIHNITAIPIFIKSKTNYIKIYYKTKIPDHSV